MEISQYWQISNRFDPMAVQLADKHYSRQKPGTNQFMPAGSCYVLRTPEGDAVFGVSSPRYTQRDYFIGALVCSIFRNESQHLSSSLILDALTCIRFLAGDASMITYVDAGKIKSSNPGYCFKMAGFLDAGFRSKDKGLVVLHRQKLPAPQMPMLYQLRMAI